MRVMLVFGTRPEAIKMCPVYLELKKRPEFDVKLCVTAQHRDMLDQILDTFEVTPDVDLDIMKPGQSLAMISSAVSSRMVEVYEEYEPDVVLVHGDTTTTYAAALAAFYLQIPVGHVEAGLRTDNIYSPFPEEFNRRSVGLVSTYDFAPTDRAAQNLLAEGKDPQNILVTGNTVIDALGYTVRPDYTNELVDWASGGRLVLLTAHRRENQGEKMRGMFRAIRNVVDRVEDAYVLYPVHKSPAVREAVSEVLEGHPRVKLVEPLDVIDFHNIMAASHLVLTDSGGIQEEAPSMGVPVLVMRDTTERPEGIDAGTVALVGTEQESIEAACIALLENEDGIYTRMSQAKNPYGDGHASERIADFLMAHEES